MAFRYIKNAADFEYYGRQFNVARSICYWSLRYYESKYNRLIEAIRILKFPARSDENHVTELKSNIVQDIIKEQSFVQNTHLLEITHYTTRIRQQSATEGPHSIAPFQKTTSNACHYRMSSNDICNIESNL